MDINETYINRIMKIVIIKIKDRTYFWSQLFNENNPRKSDFGSAYKFLK